MGISIQEYRQRIGCFKVRGYKRNTFTKQMTFSNDFGNALRVIIRLICLVALVAAVIPSSLFVLDLTQFGDVEKNPGPAQDYKFHLISDDDFEKFAVTVLGYIYNIKTLSTFSKGPDGGRDASAHAVNIDFGGGNIENNDLIVQVKHTKESGKMDDGKRKSVFEKEKEKVKKLVKNNQLDTTYIVLTNYELPALQEDKLNKCFNAAEKKTLSKKRRRAKKGVGQNHSEQLVDSFKRAGAKHVIIIGKETLSQWLGDSPKLQSKVIRYYPRGHQTDLTDCPKALQSIQLLYQYREDLKKIVDVEAFKKAEEMVKSRGLVFITGVPRSGKTTVAKQLVVKLFDKYDSFTYYDIIYPNNFDKYWIPGEKYIFFMDNIDSETMYEWSKQKDHLEIAIKDGSKFVFAGQSAAFKEVLEGSGHNEFYKYLNNAVIDLSDQQLSKDKKQEMLKKHVEMGDNEPSTKEALLKDDMLSHAAKINCPCFPLVASSLGSRGRLEKFKQVGTTVYDQKFLNQFFKSVQSTTVDSDSTSESCKSSMPKRPRQESEPSSSADIGDNITGSTSESCKSPTSKRLRLESEPMSTVDNEDDITALTEMLSDEYKDRARRHHPLPWVDKMKFELDKVYIKLHFMQRNSNGWQQTGKIVDLSHIFDKHEDKTDKNPRLILIEGSPGTGKTTLSLKLAYDWAMHGKMQSKIPPVELVLLIKCRDMKGDIFEAINEQLFPIDEDSLKEKLRKFIKEQPEKILLVVDGLDETPEAATEHVMNLLTQRCLRKCYVVATSRQEKGVKVRKYFDTLLEIKSYSESDIREYIKRYFHDPCLAKQIIQKVLDDNNLKTLARNPLNTLLLCVVFQNYDGELPSTVTELYDIIVSCITKRYCEKHDLKVEDSVLKTAKKTLGELAYKGLLEDTLSFRKSNLNDEEIHCTEMGFLTYKEDSKEMFKPADHTYWFLHKTFQEYLAAFYFTNKVERKELTVDDMIDKLKDTDNFMQVLMFVSGMLHKKDAVHHKAFVEKLGECIRLQRSQTEENKNNVLREVLDILCTVLSESPVDKDMAVIIHQFLPTNSLHVGGQSNLYARRVIKIVPRILNLLCTKEGVSKEVNLDEFSINLVHKNMSDLRLICKALKEKLAVRVLELDNCDLSDETAGDLADMLSHNTTVEVLRFQNNHFAAKEAEILAKSLGQNSTLKELNLCNNRLRDDGVKAITAVLTSDISSTDMDAGRRGSGLHTLSLEANCCGEKGALAVAKMLATNNTLTILNMSRNSLGSKGVTKIAEALKSNRTLTYLGLMNTSCNDNGVAALADMLHNNKTLTKLFISNYADEYKPCQNHVGEDGAFSLADALRVNNSLEELHLCNNDITDEGLKYFANALHGNTALQTLCIRDTDNTWPDHPLYKEKKKKLLRITLCGCDASPT